jgi:hypothetical protein
VGARSSSANAVLNGLNGLAKGQPFNADANGSAGVGSR